LSTWYYLVASKCRPFTRTTRTVDFGWGVEGFQPYGLTARSVEVANLKYLGFYGSAVGINTISKSTGRARVTGDINHFYPEFEIAARSYS